MGVWHGNDLVKPSGGRKESSRKKRKYEMGRPPTETILGKERVLKRVRTKGGGIKLRLRVAVEANVSDPRTGKTVKVPIISVEKNPASVDYNRRGVITKGAIIRTSLGLAKVTSRPGQNGVVNAVLVKPAERR